VRQRRAELACLAALALLLAAPASGAPGRAREPRAPRPGAPPVDQADVFSDREIRTWSLELPAERWRELRERAMEERWAAARLAVAGVPFGVVALRFKGAAGTLGSCFREGRSVCAKLPLKLRFDLYDPERRFFGLQRLNFHAMLRDRSLVRERLAYRVFADAGVPSPRTAYAWLTLNGEPLGLFAIVEAIDARFADRSFFFDDGLLYKEAWPTTTDAAYYEERLRSNRGAPRDHASMIGFARELAGAGPKGHAAVLERWTDADELMRYMAADRLVGNWDGITAWYCDRGPCTNHNFYWYAERGRRRLRLVPWDLDDALRLFDPLFLASDWLEPAPECGGHRLAWNERPVRDPGCDPLVAALAAVGRERFRPALREVMDRAFDPRVLRAQVLAWRSLLAPYVALDPSGPPPGAWRAELEALLASLPRLRARGEALARGEAAPAFGLDPGRRNDFETVSEASLWRSAEAAGNARSRVAHGLGLAHALAGRADLRLDFELRDDSHAPADRFLQWASLRLPFAGGATDLGRVERLRVLLRADAPRTLRIDVESARYPGDDAAARYGWDVAVSREARVATRRLADLALPAWSTATPLPLAEVLARATGLSFHPQPVGRLASGFFPAGASDAGAISIDEIELVPVAGAAEGHTPPRADRALRLDRGAGGDRGVAPPLRGG
jgi:hypothetical protein